MFRRCSGVVRGLRDYGFFLFRACHLGWVQGLMFYASGFRVWGCLGVQGSEFVLGLRLGPVQGVSLGGFGVVQGVGFGVC